MDMYANSRIALIIIFVLVAENCLKHNIWNYLLLLVISGAVLEFWPINRWKRVQRFRQDMRQKLRVHSRDLLWFALVTVWLIPYMFVFSKIPLFSDRGAWLEIAFLSTISHQYHMWMDNFLTRYVKRLEERSVGAVP